MSKPDYRRIAVLEVEEYGEVLTPEAKEFWWVGAQTRAFVVSEETKAMREAEMNALLAEFGVEP